LRSRFAPPPMPVMVWCNVVAVAPVDADRAEALTHHQEGSVARLGAELRQSRAAESPEPYCIGSPAAQNKERHAEAVSPPPCARKPSPAPSPLPSDNGRRSPAALSVGLPHRTVTGSMSELPCAMARPAGRAGAERRQTHKGEATLFPALAGGSPERCAAGPCWVPPADRSSASNRSAPRPRGASRRSPGPAVHRAACRSSSRCSRSPTGSNIDNWCL
jgi:hypothetical protein